MSSIQVRRFRRSDRDQLTQLVNAHAEAVVPGMSVSVSTVLASLERQPGEFIEDPWVAERVTVIAEQQNRVAAAAHLLRYFPDERAGVAARDVGDINWLLYWPEAPAGNPYWPHAAPAADALMAACLAQFEDWGVSRQYAGGELPVHGVYGVPEIPGVPPGGGLPRAHPDPARVDPNRVHPFGLIRSDALQLGTATLIHRR